MERFLYGVYDLHHKQSNSCIVYLIILPSFANYSILALLVNVKLAKMSFYSHSISKSKHTSDLVFTIWRDSYVENVKDYILSSFYV